MYKNIYELIKQFEGCSLKSYKCKAGKWTIGYGNTYYKDGSKVKPGDCITQQEAEELLEWFCNTQIKVPSNLKCNQRLAVQSLIYNIGQTNFDKSFLKKAIINKDIKGIFNNWNWISADGIPIPGLAKRRAIELTLFFELF